MINQEFNKARAEWGIKVLADIANTLAYLNLFTPELFAEVLTAAKTPETFTGFTQTSYAKLLDKGWLAPQKSATEWRYLKKEVTVGVTMFVKSDEGNTMFICPIGKEDPDFHRINGSLKAFGAVVKTRDPV